MGVVKHDDLVATAEKWLWKQNCGIVLRDPFRATTCQGEIPDAIGWRHNTSILVECKATRSDFLTDKSKPFRADPCQGVGDWRFYLTPPGIITVNDLPDGWGWLVYTGKQVKRTHGYPGNVRWESEKPFHGHKESEMSMLYSALRRLTVRGHLPLVYDTIAP